MRVVRRFLRVLLLIAVALLLAAAGGYFLDRTSVSTGKAAPAGRIFLHNDVGSVRVEGTARDQIDVKTTSRFSVAKPRLTRTEAGSTLRLKARCFVPLTTCKVDYDLKVPSGVELNIQTVSGDVEVSGLSGKVRIDSKVGSVSVDDLSGPLSVRTDAGSIEGDLLASASSSIFTRAGGIKLSFVEIFMNLDVETAAGNIVLLVPDVPYRVDTDMRAGKAMVKVDRAAGAGSRIKARTGAGNIRIRPTG